MAMQMLAGETLEVRLERERRLPTAEAARIGREIASGLAAAHAKGMVHRDVKPANVWLESGTGRVKLLDFGLAMARDNPHLTHSGFVIGTPAFMSPEQARGEPLDARSDLFSLGIVLYLATTGERPFDGATAMAVMRNIELHYPGRVNVKRVDVPAAFSNLIMELLAKERKDRPASAEMVAARLSRPEVTRPTHLPVAPPPEQTAAPVPALPRMRGYEFPPRTHAPRSTFSRILVLATLAAIAYGVYWYFYAANHGMLIIESSIPDAEIQVYQSGQLRYASVKGNELDLRPGSYDLVLVKPRAGYKLTRTSIRVGRGGRETVGVVRDTPGP
jgi:serine/threonine protein kinase